MDKIQKALRRLTDKERGQVKAILIKLSQKEFSGLDLVRLKGYKDIFRARRGKLRIIFRIVGEKINVLAIERRSEKSYRDF